MKLSIKRHILDENVDYEIQEKNSIIYNKNGKIAGSGIYDPNLSRIEKRYKCPKCGNDGFKPFVCTCGQEAKKVSSYIRFFCPVTNIYIDYNNVDKADKKIVQAILEYRGYVLDGEFHEYTKGSPLIEDLHLLYGADAIKALFGDKYDTFIKVNFYDYLFLVDYKYRKPVLGKTGKVINGDLNILYNNLITAENGYRKLFQYYTDPYMRMVICNKFFKVYNEFLSKFINILYTGKNSIIKKNVISQKIGGAIRAVIIPAPYIPEDCVALSTIFADTLFPQFTGLWKNASELNELIQYGHFRLPLDYFCYKDSQGYNQYLWSDDFVMEDFLSAKNMTLDTFKDVIKRASDPNRPYFGVINRPPTISHLSFYSLKPIFFDNIGRGNYAKYYNDPEKILNVSDETNPMSACMGINPIFCKGMNADFDSDVLFFKTVFSDADCCNMLPSNNYKTIANGEIKNGMEEMHEQMLSYFYKYNPEKAKMIHEMIESLEN